jgi:hypothetical protein
MEDHGNFGLVADAVSIYSIVEKPGAGYEMSFLSGDEKFARAGVLGRLPIVCSV